MAKTFSQIAKKSAHRPATKFLKETVAATGLSKDRVHRAQNRAEKIAPEVLKEIPGTSLDKGVELDALAKKPKPEQKRILAEVKAGKRTTAAPGDPTFALMPSDGPR